MLFIFSILRSVDLSTTTDSKQFQELLLERTKAFAAQTEALKSSNSDGKFQHTKHLTSHYLGTSYFWSSITLFFHHQIKQNISFSPRIVTLFLFLVLKSLDIYFVILFAFPKNKIVATFLIKCEVNDFLCHLTYNQNTFKSIHS